MALILQMSPIMPPGLFKIKINPDTENPVYISWHV